jgi:hypothetical protein
MIRNKSGFGAQKSFSGGGAFDNAQEQQMSKYRCGDGSVVATESTNG